MHEASSCFTRKQWWLSWGKTKRSLFESNINPLRLSIIKTIIWWFHFSHHSVRYLAFVLPHFQIHCFISSQKFLNTCAHHHMHPHTCTPSNSDIRAHTLTCACIHTLSYMLTHTCTHEQILTNTHPDTQRKGSRNPQQSFEQFWLSDKDGALFKNKFLRWWIAKVWWDSKFKTYLHCIIIKT